jgi:hypothetical protein
MSNGSGLVGMHAVPVDRAILDRYVGFYAPYDGWFGVYAITRHDDTLIYQCTKGRPLPLVSKSASEFLPGENAQIDFVCDTSGKTTELRMRQHGIVISARCIDALVAQRMEADLDLRVRGQKPSPGGEASLRRILESVRTGVLDSRMMFPPLAAALKAILPGLQANSARLGQVRSITFRELNGLGWDIYDVRRERGSEQWLLAVASDGTTMSMKKAPGEPRH